MTVSKIYRTTSPSSENLSTIETLSAEEKISWVKNEGESEKLILHIPHTSTYIPAAEHFILPKSEIDAEVMLLTDWYVDELFQHEKSIIVMADFSRVFCDVERFADDSHEVMSNFGMGVVYTHSDDGRLIRDVTPEQREKIIQEYYLPHHQKLTSAVEMSLRTMGKAMIIDCHSFSDRPFKRDLDQHPNRPDICIGTDAYHTSGKLIAFTTKFFNDKGLKVELNRPYSGTIVPLAFYKKVRSVQSIMIEINRRSYLQEETNLKSANFIHVQAAIKQYLEYLKSFINQRERYA